MSALNEAQEIFDQAYLVDQKNDDPEQFRAIGWWGGRFCSVVFEIRHDAGGEYYHLITAWRATLEEEQSYAENVLRAYCPQMKSRTSPRESKIFQHTSPTSSP